MNDIIYLGSNAGFEAAKDVLEESIPVVHIDADEAMVSSALLEAAGLLDASMKVHITDDMVRTAENLKIISCATTGADHIAMGELRKRNIPVRTLKEDRDLLLNITPAAELSWTLLMACARKLASAFDHVKSGQWTRELFPGTMLRGKKIGLIGCGRIGGWMGRYAAAFGMEIYGYDPYLDDLPEGFTRVSLGDMMGLCDFISVHVHLSEETRGLVSRELLEGVKPGSVIINTSRGAIIDEAALLDALESGQLGAAGLDVLEGEPDITSHPLVEYARENDNLVITPHCGGFSPDAVALVCAHAAKKILKELGLE